jgi:hypothetical protein
LRIRKEYQSGAEPPHSKGSADSGALDHYQVKDGENDFAKALPVSPVVGLLLSSTQDWD